MEAGLLAGEDAPGELDEPRQQESEADRQDQDENPALDGQVLGLDSHRVHDLEIVVGADQQDDRVDTAEQPGGDADETTSARRQLLHEDVDADLASSADAVGNP